MKMLAWANIILSIINIIIFNTLMHFINGSFTAKPLLLINVLDLVNRDLSRSFQATLTLAILSGLLQDIELDLPYWAIFFNGWFFELVSNIFMFYLSFGVIIRYLMIQKQWTDLFGLTDDVACFRVRIVIVSLATLFTSGNMMVNSTPTFLNNFPLTKDVVEEPLALWARAAVDLTLLGSAIIINIVLRTLILIDKHFDKTNTKNNTAGQDQEGWSYGALFFISFVLILYLIHLTVTQINHPESNFARKFGQTTLGVFLPLAKIAFTRTMRIHMKKKFKSMFNIRFVGGSKFVRVSPA